MKVAAVTDDRGAVVDAALLRAAERVRRRLRPHLPDDYAGRMRPAFASAKRMAPAPVAHLEELAARLGCDAFALDPGVQRDRARKFYFREGLAIKGFHFTRLLGRVRVGERAK